METSTKEELSFEARIQSVINGYNENISSILSEQTINIKKHTRKVDEFEEKISKFEVKLIKSQQENKKLTTILSDIILSLMEKSEFDFDKFISNKIKLSIKNKF